MGHGLRYLRSWPGRRGQRHRRCRPRWRRRWQWGRVRGGQDFGQKADSWRRASAFPSARTPQVVVGGCGGPGTQIGVTRREVLRPGLALGAGMGLRRRTWKDVGVVRHGPVASVGLSGSVGPAEVTAWCRADGVERITWGVLGTRTVGALVGAVAWHSEGNAFIACAGPVHPRLSLGGWMGAPPWRLGVHAVWSVAGRPVGLFSGPHPLFGWTWGVGR